MKENKGFVSVIMPSYNNAEYIADAIESVIGQSYPFWELIIVDDCSSDNTERVIKTYLGDRRIRFLKNKKNSGAAVARNYALREATGKWVAFLDSDDIWDSEKLEIQIDFMLNNNYYFTYTDYKIQLNGTWLPYIYTGPKVVTERKMKDYCYFSTITVMYDREYVGLIQIEPVRKNNDYAMWLKIIKKADCYRLPKCLSFYIKHDGSISSGSKFKLIKHHYILWKVAENKSPIISVLFTVRNVFWGIIKKLRFREIDDGGN